jgi:hypothetical protein
MANFRRLANRGNRRATFRRKSAIVTGIDVAQPAFVLTSLEQTLSPITGLFLQRPNVAFGLETLCRLTGMDEPACLAVLTALEHMQFLWRTRDGLFQLRREAAFAEDGDRQ